MSPASRLPHPGDGAPAPRPEARPENRPEPRRRLIAPLSDFVAAFRLAIAAFGQGDGAISAPAPLRPLTAADAAFFALPLARAPDAARRIVFLGELSPASGAIELLAAAAAWAEQHRGRTLELCWAGAGDLRGVLRAQLTPGNLRQIFPTAAERADRVALFARCGILAIPVSAPADPLGLAQAMAAGLVLLGSARCPELRRLAVPPAIPFLFDPLAPIGSAGHAPDSVEAALDGALATSDALLLELRAASRAAAALVAPTLALEAPPTAAPPTSDHHTPDHHTPDHRAPLWLPNGLLSANEPA